MKWSVRGCAIAAVFTVIVSTHAGRVQGAAAPDVQPAPRHDRPQKALMLDVASIGERLVAVGEHGLIIYSDDQGRHWNQAKVPVSVTLIAVSFPTRKLGWAAGHSGVILHSVDGGRSWTQQLDADGVNTVEKARIQQALERERSGDAANDRVTRLEREAQSAQDAVDSGTADPFLDIRFLDAHTGIAIGGFGLAMRTTDGGATWQSLAGRIHNPYGWHLNGLGMVGGKLYLAGERGHLYRSDDAGRSWQALESPYDGTYFGVIPDDGGDVVIAFGLEGRVYRSADAGASWQRVSAPLEAAVTDAGHLADGGLVFADASGAVVCRAAGGGDFHVVQPKGRPLTAITPVGDRTVLLAGLGGIAQLQLGDGC